MVTYVTNTTKNIMEQDHLSGATIVYTPLVLMNQAWHYGYGLWVECHYQQWQTNCTGLYSSPGKNGFYPWIDRQHGYFAIIGTFNPSFPFSTSTTLGQQLQPLILNALGLNGTADGSTSTGTSTSGSSTTATTSGSTTTGSGATTSGSTGGNDSLTTGSDSGAQAKIVNVILLFVTLIYLSL